MRKWCLEKLVSKNIGRRGKLQKFLPRAALLTIYKAVIRHHLDYGDVLFDQAYNKSFHQSNNPFNVKSAWL